MPTPKSLLQQAPALDPNHIAEYLASHRDFFIDRDELLRNLQLPHIHGGDVSLVERQVSLLRERNRDIRKQLDALIDAGTTNNDIFAKCQRLVLALLEAKDTPAFYAALELSFKRDFKCQAYSLIVFDDKAMQINHFTYSLPESDAREHVGALIKSKKPTLGVLRSSERDFLFRQASEKVQSAAVMSVKAPSKTAGGGEQIALLAIGSIDPNYFQAGMGTLFIGFIADVLARQLPSHLTPH
ncbi:MAG: DUF484 family protein [SAR86 cluster bacterium]|jgi:uncharacterized protein|tara:strand:- start:376 stop:1098 length:723 start_codon:yes stop_codon:yes gene_type:complete